MCDEETMGTIIKYLLTMEYISGMINGPGTLHSSEKNKGASSSSQFLPSLLPPFSSSNLSIFHHLLCDPLAIM